ncbi:MAG: HAMP domain-containing histidine kinase [Blautia sp.]|nr:HAMP domain-containing histidine kinase [Blautia sp.]
MRFFWKLFLSITVSVLLSVCIGGIVLLQANFRSLIVQEETRAASEDRTLYQMLKRRLDIEAEILYEDVDQDAEQELQIIKAAETLKKQLKMDGLQFQVMDHSGKGLYSSEEDLSAAPGVGIPGEGEYIHYISRTGQEYDIVGNRLLQVGGEDYYLQTRHNITPLYRHKARQYDFFRRITLMIMAVCYVVTFLLSWLVTRSIYRLSQAAGEVAEGNYEIEIPVKGTDEISSLARDFNRMAEKTKESVWKIQESKQRQQRFTDNFSHELKTPLTAMIGYADMIRSKKLSEEERVLYADHIVREGRRLEVMSMKLMDLIVLRKQDFRLREYSAKDFLNGIKETVSPLLEKDGISFQMKAEDALLRIEPDLMKTFVVNLIDNARKAVSGHGFIKVSGKLYGDVYQIEVRDNGCGMEQSELEKITEAFYMVDKSRARAEGGAGLGLAICKEILEIHGGKLIIHSAPGAGTVITVLMGGERLEI